jgi:ribosomal 50S subunit-associated protein YjgA (DUF615 family)
MKIRKVTTEIYDYDLDKELERLHKCFKGKQLKRQLAIIDALFKEKDMEKTGKLIDELPRCKKHECSEAEYLGAWTSIFGHSSWGAYESLKESDTTYEF